MTTDMHTPRWSRVAAAIGFAVLTTHAISACSRNSLARSGAALELRADQEHETLAREHSVTVEVAESELDGRFQRLADRCKTDSAHHCTILQSDVSTGQFASGLIKLRIDPGAVEELIAFAASLGRLQHRSTKVEDLAEAIQDTRSRIEMLTTYRKQLLELQAKTATNVDAAIKIASELSCGGDAAGSGRLHGPLVDGTATQVMATSPAKAMYDYDGVSEHRQTII